MPAPDESSSHGRSARERDGWPERIGRRFADGHASAAIGMVAALGYVCLTVVMVGLGLLITRVLAHGPIGHWDNAVNAYYAGHRQSLENRASGDATLIANTLGIVTIAAVVTAALLLRRWGRHALLVIIGLAVELSVFLSSNYLVARPRPAVPHLGSTPSTFSWPSGHSAATLVLYGGIAVLIMWATRRILPRVIGWLVALGGTVSVAMSRVYRGEHHPTDTMAGVLLGIGALWTATCALRAADAATSVPAVHGQQPVARRHRNEREHDRGEPVTLAAR